MSKWKTVLIFAKVLQDKRNGVNLLDDFDTSTPGALWLLRDPTLELIMTRVSPLKIGCYDMPALYYSSFMICVFVLIVVRILSSLNDLFSVREGKSPLNLYLASTVRMGVVVGCTVCFLSSFWTSLVCLMQDIGVVRPLSFNTVTFLSIFWSWMSWVPLLGSNLIGTIYYHRWSLRTVICETDRFGGLSCKRTIKMADQLCRTTYSQRCHYCLWSTHYLWCSHTLAKHKVRL